MIYRMDGAVAIYDLRGRVACSLILRDAYVYRCKRSTNQNMAYAGQTPAMGNDPSPKIHRPNFFQKSARPAAFWTFLRVFILRPNSFRLEPIGLGSWGKSKLINMKKIVKIVVIVVSGVFILMLVVCPLMETTPLPHTVENSYSTAPVSTLVAPITGSYSSGSWA